MAGHLEGVEGKCQVAAGDPMYGWAPPGSPLIVDEARVDVDVVARLDPELAFGFEYRPKARESQPSKDLVPSGTIDSEALLKTNSRRFRGA